MKNYKIEGDIDFFSELYKSLDEDALDNVIVNDDNLCLISKLPLTKYFVELCCGHKFNYVPLYKDILNHKLKFNGMESTQSHLKKTQIRCPYCRKKQEGLLPFYEDIPEIKKIEYVNYIDESKLDFNSDNYKFGNCHFIYKNLNFNIELPESDTNPSKIQCKSNTHLYKIADVSAGEYKYYCYQHKKDQMKENSVKIKEKAKQEKKAAAEKAKQEKKQEKKLVNEALKMIATKVAKLEANQKLKEMSLKNKSNLNINNVDENVVIDLTIEDNLQDSVPTKTQETSLYSCCSQIIKFGSNKGKPCGLKIACDNLCKRHYKMKIKI